MEREVVRAVHRAADADLHDRRGIDQAFGDRVIERRAVKELRPEILVPRVDVRVELDEAERAVPGRERAQDRQRDAVVAANDHRPRARLHDLLHARLDRRVRVLEVDRRGIHVAGVNDGEAVEGGEVLEVTRTGG